MDFNGTKTEDIVPNISKQVIYVSTHHTARDTKKLMAEMVPF